MKTLSPPGVRQFGAVNWLGFWTLYLREVRRFLKVFTQTVAAPVVTTLLYLGVFMLAIGGAQRSAGGVPYTAFLAPGLVMMAMMQNAFANTSSSIMIAKVQGTIVDVLMPPLSATELALAIVLGGITRGAVVGIAVALAIWLFEPLQIAHPLLVLFYGLAACMLLSLLGMIAGVWAVKFDHMSAVTNFIIMPLSFLSGTFYSVDRLPEGWRFVAHGNPFFYLIDGFRAGFIGQPESSLELGICVVVAVNAVLLIVCHQMFQRGYRLKA